MDQNLAANDHFYYKFSFLKIIERTNQFRRDLTNVCIFINQ